MSHGQIEGHSMLMPIRASNVSAAKATKIGLSFLFGTPHSSAFAWDS
jgi:hypothetical protein